MEEDEFVWTGKYASVDKKHEYDLDDACSEGVQLCVLIKSLTDIQLCQWHDATRNNINEGKQNLRVSPFQMEKLLEGKGWKDRQQFNATDAETGFKPNSFKSPVQERTNKGEALPNARSVTRTCLWLSKVGVSIALL